MQILCTFDELSNKKSKVSTGYRFVVIDVF